MFSSKRSDEFLLTSKEEKFSKSLDEFLKVSLEKRDRNRQPVEVEFRWKVKPDSFGGISKEQLVKLVQVVADFYNISDKNRKKIKVIFGDHESFSTKSLDMAACVTSYDSNKVKNVEIVINRSLELFESLYGYSYIDYIKEDIRSYKDNVLELKLKYNWEIVLWYIAEEMNHAAVHLQVNNLKKKERALFRYRNYAKNFHFDNHVFTNEYTLDLFEITAARRLLRFFSKIAVFLAPERIDIYQKAYNSSVENRMVVIPIENNDIDKNFIPTGFVSPKN